MHYSSTTHSNRFALVNCQETDRTGFVSPSTDHDYDSQWTATTYHGHTEVHNRTFDTFEEALGFVRGFVTQ